MKEHIRNDGRGIISYHAIANLINSIGPINHGLYKCVEDCRVCDAIVDYGGWDVVGPATEEYLKYVHGLFSQKYNLILMDPPWKFNKRNTNTKFGGGASSKYAMMSKSQLISMKSIINKIADDNCILLMWTLGSRKDQAIDIVREWGFTYVTEPYSWIKMQNGAIIDGSHGISGKTDHGTGTYTATAKEDIIMARKGSVKKFLQERLVPQVIFAEIGGHSAKPKEAMSRIQRTFGDIPRIEMFAREATDGWNATGLEYDGVDIMNMNYLLPSDSL